MYSGTQLFLIYSGLFFAALVFSLLIFSLFMRFARTLGIREKDQMLVRWSSSGGSIPAGSKAGPCRWCSIPGSADRWSGI